MANGELQGAGYRVQELQIANGRWQIANGRWQPAGLRPAVELETRPTGRGRV